MSFLKSLQDFLSDEDDDDVKDYRKRIPIQNRPVSIRPDPSQLASPIHFQFNEDNNNKDVSVPLNEANYSNFRIPLYEDNNFRPLNEDHNYNSNLKRPLTEANSNVFKRTVSAAESLNRFKYKEDGNAGAEKLASPQPISISSRSNSAFEDGAISIKGLDFINEEKSEPKTPKKISSNNSINEDGLPAKAKKFKTLGPSKQVTPNKFTAYNKPKELTQRILGKGNAIEENNSRQFTPRILGNNNGEKSKVTSFNKSRDRTGRLFEPDNSIDDLPEFSDDDEVSKQPRNTSTISKRFDQLQFKIPPPKIVSNDVEDVSSRSIQNKNQNIIPSSSFSFRTLDTTLLSSKRLTIDVLPPNLRNIFTFQEFNEMQSECFPSIYNTQDNCVISSPTGSGKTVLFELAILKEFSKQSIEFKVLYLAPTKALCNERLTDWNSKFLGLGITCGMLTGDTGFKEAENVRKSNIIISTPEKWDMISRRWRDYNKLFGLIKLLLVDEIHILKENRGSTLEVVITRMKKICIGLRILAISATVANAQDISTWLKLDDESILPAQTLCFGDEYRAVKLNKFVYRYKLSKDFNDFQFDQLLNTKLMEIINLHSNDKPVLIFCSTRNSCQKTAKFVTPINCGIELNLKDRELYNLVKKGVAYHHAGLSYSDRKQIESAFLNGKIKFLCCTSTLAVGINLPAYLVIIKGTRCWNENGFKEYAETDILQMLGRAGRPQFEDEGCAVIMTNEKLKLKYERLIKGTEKIESSLHLNFNEHLIAEMAVGTFMDLNDAIKWIKQTYLYVRFLLNPTYYLISNDIVQFCKSKIRELEQEQLIHDFKCTNYGMSMTMHYIQFETMKLLIHNNVKNLLITDLLDLIAKSSEFADLKLKHVEKKLYKEINKSVKYPMKQLNKINCIIQFELGGIEFPNYNGSMKLYSSFLGDKFYVFKHLPRILMVMLDVFVEKKDAGSLINTSCLLRCVNGKCWEDSSDELRQIDGVGTVNAKKFFKHGINSLNDGRSLNSSQIEYFLDLKTGAGMKIYKILSSFPEITISITLEDQKLVDNQIRLKFAIDLKVNAPVSTFKSKPIYVQVISSIGNSLIDFRRIPVRKVGNGQLYRIECFLNKIETMIDVNASTEQIAGIKTHQSLEIRLNEYLLKKFIPQWDTDEDDGFEELWKEQEEINMVEEVIQPVIPEGRIACNHKCKNKNTCAHLCCKNGLVKKKRIKEVIEEGALQEVPKLSVTELRARKRKFGDLFSDPDDEDVNKSNVINLIPEQQTKKSYVFKIGDNECAKNNEDGDGKKPHLSTFFDSSSDIEDYNVLKLFESSQIKEDQDGKLFVSDNENVHDKPKVVELDVDDNESVHEEPKFVEQDVDDDKGLNEIPKKYVSHSDGKKVPEEPNMVDFDCDDLFSQSTPQAQSNEIKSTVVPDIKPSDPVEENESNNDISDTVKGAVSNQSKEDVIETKEKGDGTAGATKQNGNNNFVALSELQIYQILETEVKSNNSIAQESDIPTDDVPFGDMTTLSTPIIEQEVAKLNQSEIQLILDFLDKEM
ncbi:unnamed protein product [Candida verbasci]|uniref:DNA 3'-5' helicase n=1 Tax=Candida verbasci TaxID=1227364 RepID=A0A9W4TWZ5_9ASCO|nr:unnamed protein product [Candida verbasci]